MWKFGFFSLSFGAGDTVRVLAMLYTSHFMFEILTTGALPVVVKTNNNLHHFFFNACMFS